jgi:hypothetical protein
VTVSGAGGGPLRCSARLSGRLDILRLITRGPMATRGQQAFGDLRPAAPGRRTAR